jgi:lipoic acid synthetase
VRQATGATIEVLPSDFGGSRAAVARLVDVAPEVYNHNTETVPRLYARVRGRKADYRWTLEMFRRIRERNPAIRTKTGLMLGLGETHEELLDTLADLLDTGCRMLTMGQYLQPSPHHLPVVRYLPPEEFTHLGELARRMGFEQVASAPFVRSSYHAREMIHGTVHGAQ